jgi:Protein of unknown function (DUF3223)
MATRRIEIETRVFPRAGDAMAFFRSMLHRYSLGDHVSDADGMELRALLALHDERVEKIGCGIDHFEVNLPPDQPGRCFWIVRNDGTKVDFSFVHCLRP